MSRKFMQKPLILLFIGIIAFTGAVFGLKNEPNKPIKLPDAKPVPQMQVIPLPYQQASIQRNGKELTRYHFGPDLHRPFLFPVIGPSGRSLTRMGHPHDPVGHSHHNSVWISHHDVNGDSFWSDRGPGQIQHRRIIRYTDGTEASILSENIWVGKDNKPYLKEYRKTTVVPLPKEEWLMILDVQFEAVTKPVTLGKTAFGMIGVRMAKTIGIHDGGGMIRNSEGNVNEKGDNGAFRKRARWVDYSGPITKDAIEGITLLDHPDNPNHPTHFHVRSDGWMGSCLTFEKEMVVEKPKRLRLRYGLYVHKNAPGVTQIENVWKEFAKERISDLSTRRK